MREGGEGEQCFSSVATRFLSFLSVCDDDLHVFAAVGGAWSLREVLGAIIFTFEVHHWLHLL